MPPTHFTIAVMSTEKGKEDVAKVIYEGVLGDSCCSLFAQAFADSIMLSGRDAYLLINEADIEWVQANISGKTVANE